MTLMLMFLYGQCHYLPSCCPPFSSSTYDLSLIHRQNNQNLIWQILYRLRTFPLKALCWIISPHICPHSEILVSLSITAANGHTSFSSESLQVMVEEPLLPSPVQLRVSRGGACGEANVTWGVTLLDATLEDIRITAGVVTIPHSEICRVFWCYGLT